MIDDAIAVIGMACRFPDAATPEEFWQNLCAGRESVRDLSDDELHAAGVDPARRADPSFVARGVVLDGFDLFDAGFFGFNPRDAQVLDPQQRLFLECAWEALENAGHDPGAIDGLAGVYGGADASGYLFNLIDNPEISRSVSPYAVALGNDKDHLTTRVAYKLNLKGPAVTIQTACSTSLVAVCQACRDLLHYQCDVALAGGSSVNVPMTAGYVWQEGGIVSPDGHCRAFDAAARGTISGSGAGIVVLKRLADALADGDRIEAVIRGFAVNNDGAEKVGYTAPSIAGQSTAIATALAMAGFDPDTIGYVEAHGTGTVLGDPIEVAALRRAFEPAARRQFCGLGSVKTNFGHLNSAAGVAGLMKTILAVKHGALPPSLHFRTPNPEIDFASSPFYVVDRLRRWQSDGVPRRAGVSSFGIGGTNAHVVLEEAPPDAAQPSARTWHLLPVSARSAAAADRAAANLREALRSDRDIDVADAAHTLQRGRARFPHRRVLDDRLEQLAAGDDDTPRPVAFLFPGQGSQRAGMGRDLYDSEPRFRERIDFCAEVLRPDLHVDLRDVLDAPLLQTELAQPALFAVEYALASLLIDWGVRPAAMLGHSLGEYVAATLAGVFDVEECLHLIAARGRLMQSTPPGAMLAVFGDFADSNLAVAAINGPSLRVLSGDLASIEAAEARLGPGACKRLHTSHAFHSALMESVVEPFVERVAATRRSAPSIPFLSNLTGTWITAEEATDPRYWGRHLRETVQFARNVEVLRQGGAPSLLLEVGPGRALSALSGALPTLPAKALQRALATIWVHGVELDWEAMYAGERRRRVALPSYPFERQRYWVDSKQRPHEFRDWFYAPLWQPAPAPEPEPEPERIIFRPHGDAENTLIALRELAQAEREIVIVTTRGARIASNEPLDPAQAMLAAAARVIAQDLRGVRARVIDVAGAVDEMLEREIASASDEPFVALRESGRWVLDYESIRLNPAAAARRLRRGGVYVVTGGFGGVGLILARHLAARDGAKLVLIGRNPRPIDDLGAEVMLERADVCDAAAMRAVAERIRRRFGAVNGVIHAAGIAGGGLIPLRTRAQIADVLAAKVRGTEIVHDVFAGPDLDFLILCSSLSAIVGGVGQFDYAAANAYQDAFAQRHAGEPTLVVSVNWDTWRAGMALRGGEAPATAITPAEGGAALDCILGGKGSQVIVSTTPLLPRIRAFRDTTAEEVAAPLAAAARPELSATYAEPGDQVETRIARIWSELLGIDRVGVDDDFVECGGHSLLAIQVVARIRQEFQVEIPLAVFFAAPTVAALAARVRGGGAGRAVPGIRPRPERVPLSYAQARLWFLHRLEGPSPTYNIAGAFRLKGALDRAGLEAALRDVVARHESLRTIFPEADGTPYQHIVPADEAVLPFAAEDIDNDALPRRMAEAAAATIELTREIPIRAWLFRLRDGEHVLQLLLHHIAADGWSMAPLWSDFAAAYAARARGRTPELAPLPLQYADYALWQREILGDENDDASVMSRQLAFWRSALAGAPEELALPALRSRPAAPSYRGGAVPLRIDARLHRRLTELCRATGTTLFMALQTAVALLLSKLGAGDDIPIGSPVAGRGERAVEELVGFFVNTLVFRTDVSGRAPFRELLARTRERDLQALDHQDVPFDRVVEALQPERTLNRHPLFQVMLVVQNAASGELALDGIEVTPVTPASDVAKFDLTFRFAEQTDGIDGTLEFSADLFDRDIAASMAARFLRLLEQCLDGSPIDVVTEAERQPLIGPALPLPPATLPQLFDAVVARHPEAVAVEAGDEALTYRDLDARASALAATLIAQGLGPERVAAILLDTTIDLVVALLAVLKTGAAFLPLDPEHPQARLDAILAAAAPTITITSPLAGRPGAVAAPALRPDHPAYVIYTSGSTGAAKGVVVTHASVANYVRWLQQTIGLGSGATALVSSAAFDLGYTALFGSLLTGGRLVLVPAELRRDPRRVIALLRDRRLTWLKATPSFLSMLLAEDEAAVAGLDTILLGGEAQKFSELARLHAAAPALRIINHYGPTEATIGCVAGAVDDELLAEAAPPQRIGRPAANVRTYVLDADLQPLPTSVRGELYVAGAALARGYLGAAALTAERFVADPFASGARMYRTGDLVRRLPGGTLEFLGRADQQVKIRGFRVEPADVERAIVAEPAVAQAAVVVHDAQFVAYVVGSPDLDALRRGLADRLPPYMIPAAFVVLDALPVTPNGKLDRRALPAPDFAPGRYRAPRSPEEEILCGIFAGVLSLPRAGIDDDFFALGGHSLIATRLVSRVRAAFGVELPIRALFEAPTVAALAERLRSAGGARPAVTRRPWPERLPLSYAQQRLWFLYRLEGPSPTYNIPAAFRMDGDLDVPALRQAFADVVERHRTLRTIFPDDDGVPYQKIVEAAPVITIEDVTESELSARIAALAVTSIDLAAELPLRVWLLRLAPRRHVMLILVHHIVSDGWSSGPLMLDLSTAYAARLRGEGPRFDELPVEYGDYALWQRALLGEEGDAGSLMSRQLAWWREALAGIPEDIALPADRPRPSRATYRGAAVPVDVDAALHASLLALAHGGGASLFMVLQAGFAALLSRLGAGNDIPIGTAIAGRADRDLERLVGLFVNTLVLRADVSGDPTFRELLARVRAFDLDAYVHQDVPFERVVDAVHPAPSLSRHPIFQVAMTLHNTPRVELDVAGLALELEPIAGDIAKFDLMLRMAEDLGPAGEPRGIGGFIEYSADRFDAATAERLSARLLRLLAAAAAAPDVPLSRLDILAAGERSMLIETFGGGGPAASAALFPPLFEDQAARDPGAPALIAGDDCLSYGALNRRANRLAHHLLSLGLGADDIVAVLMERSAGMIVAFLAAWKAGLAYLPLDPGHPPARLQQMIDDARPRCLLTTETFAARLPDGVPILAVDTPETLRAIAAAPARDPRVPLSPQSAAYVIYTSGSTGTPKGVVVPHAGIANLAVAQARRLGIGPRSRVLQFASVGFDASVSEIVMTFASGAALIVAREEERLGAPLSELLVRRQVTHATFPPILLPAIDDADRLPLEAVIVAGEACPGDLVAEWSPRLRMINAYGPTEVTVCATMSAPLAGSAAPSIGTPLPGTRVYVLDAALEPMPAGSPGELYVAGPSLARGYLGRAALTAERFVADPFADGARMYRTGDLARWNADGTLMFLGRGDEQVKIRGQRVEPAETEAALRATPGVREAAVVPIRRDDGVHLAAYYVADAKLELWPSIAEFYVYDELVYSSMARDDARNARYRAAFERHLQDAVVVEIGPGPFAILSRLAVDAGARRVYAVELLEESALRARRLVEQLGLSDKITVLHADARHVELPEPADWCISEIVGAIGGSEGSAAILNDARRLLRDPAHMLPARSVTRIAVCALPEGSFHWGFTETAAAYVERIFAEAGRAFDLRLCVKGAGRRHLLTTDDVFESLDATAPMPLEESHEIELTVTRAGIATGFLIWLTLDLGDGAPLDILEHQGSWLPLYVPAFPDGLELREGDRIVAQVERTLCANGLNPDFRISGRAGNEAFSVDIPHAAPSFRADPFHARLFAGGTIPRISPPSPATLRQRLAEVLPPYAVPSWLIEVPALPMTKSGKLDRRALPAPQRAAAGRAPRTPREKALCGIFAEVLSLPAAGVDESFFELGGSSLLAVRLLSRARASLGLDISVRDIFEAPTVAGLLERDAAPRRDEARFLENEALLPPDIDPASAAPPPRPRHAPANVLLTGATGFLGAFLMREILDQTDADVHCLVRASSPAEAMQRIRENLARYGVPAHDVVRRVRPLPGNLDQRFLGLGEMVFSALARDIDAVYHNGGAVSFVAPYESLKPHNVNGTIEILRLAANHVRKPLHFVSSLGVWSNPAYLGQVIAEDETLPRCDGLLGGYNQSKWVAEALVTAARHRGLPAKIYRPARIGGHSVTGVCNTGDFFFSQIKGSIQLGCVPAEDIAVNLAPVDYVSRGIVHLSLREDGPAVHHFYNARTVSSGTIAEQIVSAGFEVERVPAAVWLARLKEECARPSSDNVLAAFLPLFERELPDSAQGTVEFDCTTTEALLREAGIVCPPAEELMRRCLDQTISSGYLPPSCMDSAQNIA